MSHDNGLIDLSNGGTGPTVVQKAAYFMAKGHWEEKEREQAEGSGRSNRTTLNKASWSRDE